MKAGASGMGPYGRTRKCQPHEEGEHSSQHDASVAGKPLLILV